MAEAAREEALQGLEGTPEAALLFRLEHSNKSQEPCVRLSPLQGCWGVPPQGGV